MDIFNFFDLILLVLILSLIAYAVKEHKFNIFYMFVKQTVVFMSAAKYTYLMSSYLIKFHIIMPDTFGVQLIFGFIFNILFFYMVFYAVETFSKNKFAGKIIILKQISNNIVIVVGSIMITTLLIFFLMQFNISKKLIGGYIEKSFSYPLVKRGYSKVLSRGFVMTHVLTYNQI